MPAISVHMLGLDILFVAPEDERSATGVDVEKILHSQCFSWFSFLPYESC